MLFRSIGKLTHFLGLQIHQQDLGIFLSPSKYAKNLVKKFGLESTSFVRTPMSPNVKLTIDLLGKSVDSSLYRSMIGSLLYLTASRLDINYSVGVLLDIRLIPKSLYDCFEKNHEVCQNHCRLWCVVQQGHK